MKKSEVLIIILVTILIAIVTCKTPPSPNTSVKSDDTATYIPPDTSTIPKDEFGEMVRYGRKLVMNTAYYIGPNGTVGHYLGNKMNCAHCHVDGGTRPYGFNFFSTHARYPQYRGRENAVLNLGDRINNCVERPHNGTPLPANSNELLAIECYMKWLSSNVPIGQHVKGDESLEIAFPDRSADIGKGAAIYAAECTPCHGNDGEGKWNADSTTYLYPPLWGMNSYQNGSSPSRVLKLARFIKANMPDGKATWEKTVFNR